MSKENVYFKNILNNPIRIKVFFAFTFIFFALIISTLSFFISYSYEKKYLNKQIEKDANNLMRHKIDYLKHHVDMYKHSLYSITNNKIFNDYIHNKTHKPEVTSLFSHVISSDNSIMQIRHIDENGMEQIRFERVSPKKEYKLIKDELLQNKRDRYYFQETKSLSANSTVWISDLDLNMENGKIIKPYVPTMRFARPVYEDNKFRGIVIINIFMKNILEHLSNSSMFNVSLVEKDGEFIIGKYELNNQIVDLSWSRYIMSKKDKKTVLPQGTDLIKNAEPNYTFSFPISNTIGLIQDLTLILNVKNSKLKDIEEITFDKVFDTIILVLLLSGPLGLLLASVPSFLSTKVFKATKKLEEKSLLFDEYLEGMNINNIISKSDTKGIITYVNNNFCQVSGYSEDEVIGKPHSILRNPEESSQTYKILWLTIQSGKVWKGILKNRKKDGTFYDVDIAIVPIVNTNNDITEYFAIRHEITELVKQRKNLLTIATKDSLCDVGNRYKLMMDIKKNVLNNIAVIDIDKFSNINDFYGHKIGDEIIIKFSQLLQENLTDGLELFRLHSDKFAIHNYTLSNDKFKNFINNLNNLMIDSVIETDVKAFDIVTTSGLSFSDNETILSTAEIANKYAKKMKAKLLVYSEDLHIEDEFSNNIKWTEIVKKAIIKDKIVMQYQPIYNNKTQEIEKYESLVRIQDKDGSFISPSHFLDIAKTSGQYIDISKIVVQKSFEKFQSTDVEFSINLTIEDILDKDFREYLYMMLSKYNVAKQVVFEVVESEGIEEFELIHDFIQKVKLYGCQVAIDDFGTGYSNFEYLVKLDIDYIKIDGSMIKNINEDENMKNIVSTIVEFAKKMEYKIIAEYVSSKEILDTVQDMGIDYSQGYFIGEPSNDLIKV